MEHRPLDLVDMGTLNYDITAYQPVLFCADSLDEPHDLTKIVFHLGPNTLRGSGGAKPPAASAQIPQQNRHPWPAT